MYKILRIAAFMTSLTAVSVAAEDAPVVVELYTSQGCSSCPPADDMLVELSTRPDVIALAMHVDYWDYIGWVDEFANPQNTRRQQDYARAAGETTIYTPQFVIGGTDIVIGARGMDVADLIAHHRIQDYAVNVDLKWSGDVVAIAAVLGQNGTNGRYVVQLAQILPVQSVEIRRGENAGKTIQYSSVVQSLKVVAQWDGATPLAIDADVTGAAQVAVIVQDGTNGPIVGAAKVLR